MYFDREKAEGGLSRTRLGGAGVEVNRQITARQTCIGEQQAPRSLSNKGRRRQRPARAPPIIMCMPLCSASLIDVFNVYASLLGIRCHTGGRVCTEWCDDWAWEGPGSRWNEWQVAEWLMAHWHRQDIWWKRPRCQRPRLIWEGYWMSC